MASSAVTLRSTTFSGILIEVCIGDITEEPVEAIVNAANEYLAHGAGVAGAIVKKGGEIIQDLSSIHVAEHGPVPMGEAVATMAGNLPMKCVVHAVGPMWENGMIGEDITLRNCLLASFAQAEQHGCQSISFPAISSGIFGYPKPKCAQDFFKAIEQYVEINSPNKIPHIRLTNFDYETANIFAEEFDVWSKAKADAAQATG